MLKHLNALISHSVYPIVITIVVLLISLTNYVPGTTLTGWDNLHSEFNLPLNIERSISAVWQEYQGVGLVGGMAHASDLSRELILVLVSPFIAVESLRYFWTFLMLLIGPLGAYYLLVFLTKGNKTAAFLGGLFYLLNFATVQYFYTPYESFSSFYGFLPWFLFATLSYLYRQSPKSALFLFGIFILGSSAFYVQTLFIVLCIVLSIFVCEYLLTHGGKKGIPAVLGVAGLIFAASAYWLLPVLYFTATNASVVSSSQINSIATIETQYMTQSFGDIAHVAKLQGFWLNYIDTQGNEYDYLMKPWRTYLSEFTVGATAIILFALALLGVVSSYLMRKKKGMYVLAPGIMILICFVMLSGGTGPFGAVYSFIAETIPFFGQLFRSAFTKWSPVLALFLGIGIATFVSSIDSLLGRNALKRTVKTGALLIFASLMVYSVKPVFSGNLISSNMRLAMPTQYQELFEYFKKQPEEARIAFMPAHTFWGWNFYDWGYRGSGFLWYGLRQPILDRAFDVWSTENESFYSEFRTALDRRDSTLLTQVVSKFDVTYILIDRSVIVPESTNELVTQAELTLLSEAGFTKSWESGALSVYQKAFGDSSFVRGNSDVRSVSTNISKPIIDTSFLSGNYIAHENGDRYPLASVLTPRTANLSYRTDLTGTEYLQFVIPFKKGETLVIPPLLETFEVSGTVSYEGRVVTIQLNNPALVTGADAETTTSLEPLYVETNEQYNTIHLALGAKVITVSQGQGVKFSGLEISPEKDFPLYIFDADSTSPISLESQAETPFNTCWEREKGTGKFSIEKTTEGTRITTTDAVACSAYKVGSFLGNKHLLSVSLPFKSDTRARPDFCLVKEGETTCLHDEIFYAETTSINWKETQRQIFIDSDQTYWLIVSARPSDTPHESWAIDYQMPKVSVSRAVGTFTIKSAFWETLKTEKTIIADKDTQELTVLIPLSAHPIDILSSGRGVAYNCDIFERGTVSRIISGQSVIFGANGAGTECDYRLLKDLFVHNDYVLRVKGENTKGRSLKLYAFNQKTYRNNLELLLPSQSFDTSVLLPASGPQEEPKGTYTVNFEARSYGEETETRVDEMVAYSVPVTWLGKWKVSQEETPSFVPSEYKPEGKYGTWLYRGTVSTTTPGNAVISLSQGYNRGWVLISHGQIAPSVRFNSWSNAWVFPVTAESQTITILYMPQLLEYIGFLTIAIGCMILIKRFAQKAH